MFDKSSKKMFSTCDSKMKNEMEIHSRSIKLNDFMDLCVS